MTATDCDVDDDSSGESDTDGSSDSLNIILTQSLCRALVCFGFFIIIISSVRILFSLPHFAGPASRKTELQKNYLSAFGSLSALRNTRVF